MSEFDDLFQMRMRRPFPELTRIPTPEETVAKKKKEVQSRHPLRPLGQASDGLVSLAEEERESHIHILGAPGQGKSKFLELLIRQDIDRGYGCCLLDPNRGDTVYSVLRYCAKKGHDKVLLIDPGDAFTRDKLCTLNPFGRIEYPTGKEPRYNKHTSEAVADTMDTMRVLWGDKTHEGTARINKYLPAVLKALHRSRATLHDAVYFAVQQDAAYGIRRSLILDSLHHLDKDRVTLETLFGGPKRKRTTPSIFNLEFDSTIRRLNPLHDDLMKLMLGSNNTPVSFMKMVAEGWVILVNLDPARIWSKEQERLLGTLVINELIFAVQRLIDVQPKLRGRPYYVYVDEAGKYATPKLAEILDYKRHIGIRFALAHQRFRQFEDPDVRSSVKGSTRIKVLFNTPDDQDRLEMMKMMYGGKLPENEVLYALGNLQKRQAAIKINTQPPRITRIDPVPEVTLPDSVLRDYKDEIYRNEWYASKEEILHEIDARFTQPRRTTKGQPAAGDRPGAKEPTPSEHAAAGATDGLGQGGESESTYFDEVVPVSGEPERHGEDPAAPRKRRGRPRKAKGTDGKAVP
jgi:hypothetical protein